MEGGCYAKCVGLTRDKEPEIYDAIRFGSVLENVVYDDSTREVDFDDTSITENTRLAYPLNSSPTPEFQLWLITIPKMSFCSLVMLLVFCLQCQSSRMHR